MNLQGVFDLSTTWISHILQLDSYLYVDFGGWWIYGFEDWKEEWLLFHLLVLCRFVGYLVSESGLSYLFMFRLLRSRESFLNSNNLYESNISIVLSCMSKWIIIGIVACSPSNVLINSVSYDWYCYWELL